ncbi:MAG: imidazole glycerol phosphate synthase subunit HisH [Deltaproteobacteria bacterium]|nr:imidazole glycerol phosphate synthase subunit HisH [Deltaproteobacteria bacterium]
MIAIVDYGAGNVESVRRAIAHVGSTAVLTDDPSELARAELLVFPGQGHFAQAVARLHERGLAEVLRAHIDAGKPFVGVCLGLQLLFDRSEEAPGVAGLGIFPGEVRRFAPRDAHGERVKIPQIGWNAVHCARAGTVLDAVPDASSFYFVHSYHVVPDDPGVVAGTAEHGGRFVAAVARDNVFAAQFHPEKSGAAGLALWTAILGPRWWGRPC